MKKNNNTYYEKFPKTSHNIEIGDIWLVKFSYHEKGNFYKLRPAIIVGFDDEMEKIQVQMITTKATYNNKKNTPLPFYLEKSRKSYIAKFKCWVGSDYIIRRLKSIEEIRDYKLDEIR